MGRSEDLGERTGAESALAASLASVPLAMRERRDLVPLLARAIGAAGVSSRLGLLLGDEGVLRWAPYSFGVDPDALSGWTVVIEEHPDLSDWCESQGPPRAWEPPSQTMPLLPPGELRLQRVLAAPLIHDGQLLGVVMLADKAEAYTEQDMSALSAVLPWLATTVAVSSLMADQRETAVVEELLTELIRGKRSPRRTRAALMRTLSVNLDSHGAAPDASFTAHQRRLVQRWGAVMHDHERLAQAEAEQRTSIRDAERERLAVQLHDGALQLLFAADAQLSSPTAASVEAARSLVIDSAQALRVLCRGASAPPRSLTEQLAALAPELTKLYGARSIVQVDMDDVATTWLHDLQPEISSLLGRSVRELVLNALKHARATRIDVGLTGRAGSVLVVTVEDDGVGFDPAVCADTGFGMASVRRAVDARGGVLQVGPRASGGTLARIEMPV